MATYSYIKLYSAKGGIIRFSYSVEKLIELVDTETQFVGRNLKSESGHIDTDKISGPDDKEFVRRAIKNTSDTLDILLPKHIKPYDLPMIESSEDVITVTLVESGKATRAVADQVYEFLKSYLVNSIIYLWYLKVGMAAPSFEGLRIQAAHSLQKTLLQSFTVGRTHGSRYPCISLYDIRRTLQGKFLGSYKSYADLTDVHQPDLAVADIAYVEDDYVIYNGSTFDNLADKIETATKISAIDGADYPEASLGDLYLITRSGVIGEYKDRCYAGDALLCIRDNAGNNHKNTLENFIAITKTD